MTREEAADFANVIESFSRGSEVEFWYATTSEWRRCDDPSFSPSYKWRIKPVPPKPTYRPYADPSEVDRIGEIAEYRHAGAFACGPVYVYQTCGADEKWIYVGPIHMPPQDALKYVTYHSDGEPCGVKVEGARVNREDAMGRPNCLHCGGLKAVRNPTGQCDHLNWPENLTDEAKVANGIAVAAKEAGK
jgi:hypothetical protein